MRKLRVLEVLSSGSKGLVVLYTGDGKGKTTAAMGLALRAAGYQKKVLVIQFVKTRFTGELGGFKNLDNVEFIQAGRGFFQIQSDQLTPEEHVQAARQALELARTKLATGDYHVVVLDEIVGTVTGGLLALNDVLELIRGKPKHVDLVLTGHQALKYPELIEAADLVTEMKKIKHPYDQGILAKRGIDY